MRVTEGATALGGARNVSEPHLWRFRFPDATPIRGDWEIIHGYSTEAIGLLVSVNLNSISTNCGTRS